MDRVMGSGCERRGENERGKMLGLSKRRGLTE